MKEYRLSSVVKKVFETDGCHSEWGGYYTYSFLDDDNRKLLCHRTDFDGRQVTSEDRVQLGWYDLQTAEWNTLGESDSFNWQQGSMLQWIPGTRGKQAIYNCSKEGKLISCVKDLETGETRELCAPIYCLTPDGKKAITLSFERSYWSLAYHYQSVVDPSYDVRVVPGDGVFQLDLETNTLKRIVALENVIAMDATPDFAFARHWIEHIVVNKEGTKFTFLHRFSTPICTRATRMFVADIDGSNLRLIPGWREFSWSHFGWKTESDFVVYSFPKKYMVASDARPVERTTSVQHPASMKSTLIGVLRRIIKPLIPTAVRRHLTLHGGYQMYALQDDKYVLRETYEGRLLDIDGHPSFEATGTYMVTDSYADEKKYRRLLVRNCATNKTMEIGRFYAPLVGNPAACDLHPKLSANEQYVVVDTACSGKHRMMVLKMDWARIRKKLS